MDVEERKQLFYDFASCKKMKVSKSGKVISSEKIIIEHVLVNKKGDVLVEWHYNCYDQFHTAEVDVVYSAWDDYIEGIFTDEVVAKKVAEEWFQQQKKEKIAELEAELKRLKES